MPTASSEVPLLKLEKLLAKDSLRILFQLRQGNCRFSELAGNSFTKSKRLKELKETGLIITKILNPQSKDKTIVGYELTEKGERILVQIDFLIKLL